MKAVEKAGFAAALKAKRLTLVPRRGMTQGGRSGPWPRPSSSWSTPRTSSTSRARCASRRTSGSSACGWWIPRCSTPGASRGSRTTRRTSSTRIEILPSLEAALADCVSSLRADRPGARGQAEDAAAARGGGRAVAGPRGRAGGDRRGPRGQRAHQRRARPLPHGRDHRDRPAPLLAQPGAGGGDHGLRDLERARRRGAAAQAAPAARRRPPRRSSSSRSSPTGTRRSGPSTSSRPAGRRV